jgi:hypothetical protein
MLWGCMYSSMHSSSWLGSCEAPHSYSADARFKSQPSVLADIFVNFRSTYNHISGCTRIRPLKFPYKSLSIHLSSHHSTLYSVVAQSTAFLTSARDGGALLVSRPSCFTSGERAPIGGKAWRAPEPV